MLRFRVALTAALAALLVAACGSSPPPGPKSPRPAHAKGAPAAVGTTEEGLASYYADSLAGHATASGEPYDPTALTAAHRTLPLGTFVEVSREDGRRVVVRINDRGPFGHKKRVLDLSRRAAEELGIVRAGVAKITLRVVEPR